MYTTKKLNHDLYQICTKYFVKFNLLQDFVNHRIDKNLFVQKLKLNKEDREITQILTEVRKILDKIQQNGGKLDEDPIDVAKKLRKMGKQKEAVHAILPYLQANQDDEDAAITFGWIMYDYLKLSEGNINQYINSLKVLNDNALLCFQNDNFGVFSSNDSKKRLVNLILWSVRRVVMKGELFANKVLSQLLRFCNEAQFIENRGLHVNNEEASASRSLIKEIIRKLNDENYLLFMDAIGFGWFDQGDQKNTSFINDNGEKVEVRPLAEVILNYHAKKLLTLDIKIATEQRIHSMIDVLMMHIRKNPSFEWLPYYRGKLLMKVHRNDEAFETVTTFARTKSKEFWVWDLISELVNDDAKFNCLCAGLLCKSKPAMIVGLQEKIIPILVEKEMFANAKFELDKLISTRMKNWGKITQQLEKWKEERWYIDAKSVKTRDALKDFADKAEEILYQSLSFTDIFVTHINKDKGVIHFAYIGNSRFPNIEEGYFYMDSIISFQKWKTDQALKVRMIADQKKPKLFRVYKVLPGEEAFISHFIQTEAGYVDKENTNPFAFVNDVYISPKLVEEHRIGDYDKVEYIKKIRFNKKKNTWSWMVEKITSVVKNEQTEDWEEEY